MNRKQKIIVSVTGIFLVLLILLGLTYAYFLTKIQGNTNSKSISVTTANLILEYADIENVLVSLENVEPGVTLTKKFKATNKGNSTVTGYGVVLENVINTFERKTDVVYTLECTSSDGSICNGTSNVTFPSSNAAMVTNTIAEGVTDTYTLTVTYKEMHIDQSKDMNKEISAKINLVDNRDINTTNLAVLNDEILGENNSNVLTSEKPPYQMVESKLCDDYQDDGVDYGDFTCSYWYYWGTFDIGVYKSTDDYGDTYYYTGNVDNNYVSFANQLWRIVRINGDGTIRLITEEGIDNNKEYYYNKDTCYGPNRDDNTYNTRLENSLIPAELNKWYNTNLIQYQNKLEKRIFCEETSKLYVNTTASFDCPDDNIMQSYIGLISYAELLFSGNDIYNEFTDRKHFTYLAKTKNFSWTIPAYDQSPPSMFVTPTYDSDGNGLSEFLNKEMIYPSVRSSITTGECSGTSDGSAGIRPVINLKANSKIVNGTGTIDSPYIIS